MSNFRKTAGWIFTCAFALVAMAILIETGESPFLVAGLAIAFAAFGTTVGCVFNKARAKPGKAHGSFFAISDLEQLNGKDLLSIAFAMLFAIAMIATTILLFGR